MSYTAGFKLQVIETMEQSKVVNVHTLHQMNLHKALSAFFSVYVWGVGKYDLKSDATYTQANTYDNNR